MSRQYIKKIELNSEEWKLYRDKIFDDDFCYDKNEKNKAYKYFYLNQENKNIFKIANDKLVNLEHVNYYMLRDYQKEPLQYILKNRKVILNLPVRFGKSYLAISTILNNKKNSILFVDRNMIQEFKDIFSKHNENNVFIYHDKLNNSIFEELNSLEYKIIITTEETFISRVKNKKISQLGLINISLIENVIIDEYHNFIKKADKRYKEFKKIIKNYFKNIDIFMLMSATPTNEYIFNVFYAIGLLDKNFILTHWLDKCSKVTINNFKSFDRVITNEKCLKGIIEDALYTWNEIDPFCSIKIKEIFIDQDEIYFHVVNEKNNIKRQKIIDDYRLNENIIYKDLPKKIKKAIDILKENVNKKIVIFTYFKKSEIFIKEDLRQNNIDSEYINSDVSDKKRLEIINNFQNNNLNVLIIEIKTAIGITLDKADIGIMICDEYEPQKYYQALGRIISTDFSNPMLKNIYWIYDKNINSKQNIEQKLNTLDRFGINYSPFNELDVWVYLESDSDKKFIERLIGGYPKFKLFSRNKSKFNPNILVAYEQIGLNYIFICDNDKVIYDYKLNERNLKFITYNELFNVDNTRKNIEDVLLTLNCYEEWKIKVIENCDESINTHYKDFIYSLENIENINDENSKNYLINFLNSSTDEINYHNVVEDLYSYIKEAILFHSNESKPFKNIKSIMKSYFMSKIDDSFIERYSKLFIENLNNKLDKYKLRDYKKYRRLR